MQEKEADEEAGIIVESPTKENSLTRLEEWENSLMSSTSYAQLFIHMTTLENSILWSK